MAAPPAPIPRRRPLRRWLLLGGGLLAVWLGAGLAGALLLTSPNPRPAAPLREWAGRPIEPVATVTGDGVAVRGWWIGSADPSRAVVLAAGIRGNRHSLLSRATWYLEHGWSVLAVDLRGTGESEPRRIAMGWHEALDLLAWREFLRQRGTDRVGVHGQSLGAAAAAYTAVRGNGPPDWHFAVLEACYRDIDAALAARLPLVPGPLLWPLRRSAEWLLSVAADELSPERAVRRLSAPTLFVCGELDHKVGPQAVEALFAASAAVHKDRCIVQGLGHVDLWSAAGQPVQQAMARFLAAR